MTIHPALPQPARTRTDPASGSILPVRVILGIATLTMAAVGGAVALFHATGRDWWVLLRDPAAAFEFAPSAGLFSHLGVLAMAIGGAIAVFAALLLPGGGRQRLVLVLAGALSLWLAVDDLFLLHEKLLPRLIGLPEKVTLGLYVLLALGLMRLIGAQVFSRGYLGFWVAVGFLVVMLATDIAFEVATSASFLVEEVAKLCGFVLWSAFWIAHARAQLRLVMAQPTSAA
jgi:hypothetical protein